jgi:K+/H+ antiporter YhaU regulatory subunit KhtT
MHFTVADQAGFLEDETRDPDAIEQRFEADQKAADQISNILSAQANLISKEEQLNRQGSATSLP